MVYVLHFLCLSLKGTSKQLHRLLVQSTTVRRGSTAKVLHCTIAEVMFSRVIHVTVMRGDHAVHTLYTCVCTCMCE